MSDIAKQKQASRKAAMAVRKTAHDTASGAGDAAAVHLLKWLKSKPSVRVISGYMPIHSELDILPAMHQLHALGYQICVPVIIAKATPLKFREWNPEVSMLRGEFGALIPESGAWLLPDLLLCPLLAYDSFGQRMGYGGGFYDRSIAELKAQKKVEALGYAYSAQRVSQLPSEPTDMPLDGVVIELGITWTAKSSGQ